MIWLFFGGHLLLILLYGICIERGKSKMQYTHLLLALLLPIAGVLCMLLCEFLPSREAAYDAALYARTPSRKQDALWQLPDDWRQFLLASTTDEARSLLLDVIDYNPREKNAVLVQALRSEDKEIVHIASAAVMRERKAFEDRINAITEKRKQQPRQYKLLLELTESIDEYVESGLVSGEMKNQLIWQEVHLLREYLRVFPEDRERETRLRQLTDKG